MNLWLFLLIPALAVPFLSAVLTRGRGRDAKAVRNLCAPAVHIACLALWTVVAALAAAPGGDGGKPDGGLAAAVMLAGIVWVETVHLIAIHRRAHAAGHGAGGAGGAAARIPGQTVASGPGPNLGVDIDGRTAASGRPDAPGADERRRHGDLRREAAPFPPQAEVLLNRILGLASLPLESIMTGRDRIVFVDGSLTADRALMRMAETRRSRLPVTADGSPDRILGVVHAKDLVPLVLADSRKAPVRSYLRRWLRVPRGQSAAQLLEDFRRNRAHVGVVGDAMGRTQGLVTLGDIFRYIAGTPDGSTQEPEGRGQP